MVKPKIWSFRCSKLGRIESDALNLYSFQYATHPRFIGAYHLSEVKFSFHRSEAEIEDFDESKQLKLIIYSTQSMRIFEDPSESSEVFASPSKADMFLLQNDECKMEVTASSFEAAKIAYRWLSESHGVSLGLLSSNTLLLQLIYKMVMEREREPRYCKFCSEKCWKHYVEDVFEVPDDFDDAVNTSYAFTWRRSI